jgi:hypothetical protein
MNWIQLIILISSNIAIAWIVYAMKNKKEERRHNIIITQLIGLVAGDYASTMLLQSIKDDIKDLNKRFKDRGF